ncbi:Phosphatidylinositol-4-phosphate 5-kinase [Kickxella alabastrina]|nr:Phosphatidylinositol-4-phosphate 5-kinase [Kickxella alabastrina]
MPLALEGTFTTRGYRTRMYDKYQMQTVQELLMDPVVLPYQSSSSVSTHALPSMSTRTTHSYGHEHEGRSSAVRVSSLLPGARTTPMGSSRGVRKSVSPSESYAAAGSAGMAVQHQYLVQRVPNRSLGEGIGQTSNESIAHSSSQIRLASPQVRLSGQLHRALSPEDPDTPSGLSARDKVAIANGIAPSYFADTEMDPSHSDTKAGADTWASSNDKAQGQEQSAIRREARDSWNIPSDDNGARQTDRQKRRQALQSLVVSERFHVQTLPLQPTSLLAGALREKPSMSTVMADSPIDGQYHTNSPLSASISTKSYYPGLNDYLYGVSSADDEPAAQPNGLPLQASGASIDGGGAGKARIPSHQRLQLDHRATSFDLGRIGRSASSVGGGATTNRHASGPPSRHSPAAWVPSPASFGAGRVEALARLGTRSSERLAPTSPRADKAPTERVEEGYEGDSEVMLGGGLRLPVQRRNTVAGEKIDEMAALSQRPPRMKMTRNTSDFVGMAYGKDERRTMRGSRRRSMTQAQSQALMPIGTQIAPGHANYVLMYNMLTGIRVSVSRCEAKDPRPVRDDDYEATHKYSFDVVGDEMTPSSRYDFKFKDYAPWVFRCIREAFHLSTEDYLVSLTDKYILSEVGSSGKSGSFFYYSQDYRFIIKTVHHTEHKFMRDILPQYYEFVRDHPHTLLSRIYGLHRIKLPHGRKVHFIVMSNIMPPNRDIHAQFDLKGSMLGRELSAELAAKPRACMKDKNWVKMRQTLHLGPAKRRAFAKQLIEDVTLLIRLNIMDYSLLVGIHDLTQGNAAKLRDTTLAMFDPQTTDVTQINRLTRAYTIRKKVVHTDPVTLDALPLGTAPPLPEAMFQELSHSAFYREDGGIMATDRNDNPAQLIYYLGVIDILTPYNMFKRTEHFVKAIVHDGSQISAINPRKYGLRFLRFMIQSLDGYEDVMPMLEEFERTTYDSICREHRLF